MLFNSVQTYMIGMRVSGDFWHSKPVLCMVTGVNFANILHADILNKSSARNFFVLIF